MPKSCDPDEIALKSFFLGPQAENAELVRHSFQRIIDRWIVWRQSRFPDDGRAISAYDKMTPEFQSDIRRIDAMVEHLLQRFESEVPKFSPRYIGHMFSEISLPALFGHCISLLHNPNNVSAEASRVGVQIEQEAINELLTMCGFDHRTGTGHFTSGGTIANFEAAIRAKWRLSLWLSAACAGKLHKLWDGSFFDAANLGWQRYNELIRQLKGSEETLADFAIYDRSARSASRRIEATLGSYYDPVILVPAHRHYSWEKISVLLGYGRENLLTIELDQHGTASIRDLEQKIAWCRQNQRPIAMIISVLGTTEMGLVDPIHKIHDLIHRYNRSSGINTWHHVDAAFGGFFCSLKDSHGLIDEQFNRDLNSVRFADSVTIDPHKLGYVPYACGAFLIRDQRFNRIPTQESPYIDFQKSDTSHFTIEGSRSAAGATATWLTAKTIGFNRDGYGRILNRTIEATRVLRRALQETIQDVHIPTAADTNILCFCVGRSGESITAVNARTQKIFEHFSPYKESDFFVSKTEIDINCYHEFLKANFPDWYPDKDSSRLMLIRVCLMNPFFTSAEPNVSYPEAFAKSLANILKHYNASEKICV